MYALMSRVYYWLRMKANIEAFVKYCLVYQQDKVERRVEAGLLQPLLTPETSVLMHFVPSFPKVKGLSSVLVVVDRFSKYTVFLVTHMHAQPR